MPHRYRPFFYLAVLLIVSAPFFQLLAEQEDSPLYTVEGFTLIIHEGVTDIGEPPEKKETNHDAPANVETTAKEDLPRVYLNEWFNNDDLEFDRIQFPASLRRLGKGVFYHYGLFELDFPEGFESFTEHSFYECYIGILRLPSTFKDPADTLKYDCRVGRFEVSKDNPYFCSIDGVLYSKDMQTLIRYPERTDRHFEIPSGIRTIADYAFNESYSLQSISLPLGLKKIGDFAFSDCGRLTAVALPVTMKEIGEYAFSNCVSLQRVSLPPSLAVSSEVFFNCPLLEEKLPYEGDNGTIEFYGENSKYVPMDWIQGFDGQMTVDSAGEQIAVFASPNENSQAIAWLPGGTYCVVNELSKGWADIDYTANLENKVAGDIALPTNRNRILEGHGFVRSQHIQKVIHNKLFKCIGLKPRHNSVQVFDTNKAALPQQAKMTIASLPSQDISLWGIYGNLVQFAYQTPEVDDGTRYFRTHRCFALVRDFRFVREPLGDGKTFCIIAPPDGLETLFEAPDGSKAVGHCQPGEQAEVLGHGDTYSLISTGYIKGYARTTSLIIVPEKANER